MLPIEFAMPSRSFMAKQAVDESASIDVLLELQSSLFYKAIAFFDLMINSRNNLRLKSRAAVQNCVQNCVAMVRIFEIMVRIS